jgi:hypothetical protein
MSQQFPPEEQVTRRHPGTRPPQSSLKTQQYRKPPPDYDDGPEPESSSLYVPWWGFALVILIVAGLTCGLWGVVLLSRGSAAGGPTPTPIFVVIVPTPTLGPASEGTVPPESIPSATPEEVATTEPTPDTNLNVAISIGNIIVIEGTGGDGLAVRQGPGLDYQYIFVANDGDQFEVQDGPREANEYTWWYIADPENPDRFGWAVVNFMRVVQ